MTEPINGDELLARIQPKLKEHRTQICLRPDLVARWESMNEELEKLLEKPSSSGRLAGEAAPTAAAKKLAREIQKLEDEIGEASVWFTYRALPSADYRALCAKFPPRDKNQFDLLVGYDQDAVAEVIMAPRRGAGPGCLIEPVFSDEGWAALNANLAPSEWQELREAAFEANGGTRTAPKSLLASQVLSRSGSASA